MSGKTMLQRWILFVGLGINPRKKSGNGKLILEWSPKHCRLFWDPKSNQNHCCFYHRERSRDMSFAVCSFQHNFPSPQIMRIQLSDKKTSDKWECISVSSFGLLNFCLSWSSLMVKRHQVNLQVFLSFLSLLNPWVGNKEKPPKPNRLKHTFITSQQMQMVVQGTQSLFAGLLRQ